MTVCSARVKMMKMFSETRALSEGHVTVTQGLKSNSRAGVKDIVSLMFGCYNIFNKFNNCSNSLKDSLCSYSKWFNTTSPTLTDFYLVFIIVRHNVAVSVLT